MTKKKTLSLFHPDDAHSCSLPFSEGTVPAGFPSPAEDYIENHLDLNDYLIQHRAATFFVRVQGESMIDANIYPDDIVIVDRAIEPKDNMIVIAVIDGAFTLKRIRIKKTGAFLEANNSCFAPIFFKEGENVQIWGVVTFIIHKAR